MVGRIILNPPWGPTNLSSATNILSGGLRIIRPTVIAPCLTHASGEPTLAPPMKTLRFFIFGLLVSVAHGETRTIPIYADGWAGSSVNMLANQSSTLITAGEFQYAAFYAADSHLVIARRSLTSAKWSTRKSDYTGNVADAHNTVSIAVDGDGYLHVAWDHHANPLNYCRSVAPHSIELGPKMPMTGLLENSVTYPLFFSHPDGGLLFLYRDGRSGKGNVVLNRYDVKLRQWRQVHENLIDGEGARSAYLAAALDTQGALHLVWNWRDNPDVSSNHDLCYAKSPDGGDTWVTTKGATLKLPITAVTAEYALRIPQLSTMMNPPSLTTDAAGHPLIVNYWTPPGTMVPQFHLVRHDGSHWSVTIISHRTLSFSLKGTSTKRPPISRAAVFAGKTSAGFIYRDDERGGKVILALCNHLDDPTWRETELTTESVDAWEPSIDAAQWKQFGQIHLLIQSVQQLDGNDSKPAHIPATPVSSLVWAPNAP